MATKLTAQQKRDREFMQLMTDRVNELEQRHQAELANHGNQNYSLGLEQGEIQARYNFSKLSLWQRIWFRP